LCGYIWVVTLVIAYDLDVVDTITDQLWTVVTIFVGIIIDCAQLFIPGLGDSLFGIDDAPVLIMFLILLGASLAFGSWKMVKK